MRYFEKREADGSATLWVEERISLDPVLFLARWTDAAGKACTDTLCIHCFEEHGGAYSEPMVKLHPVTPEDACSYCGFPIRERPATLREFCNYHA